MKKAFLTICVAVALSSTAQAGGFNLSWGTGCWQDNPSTLQTFACDSNDGSMAFTVSYVPDHNLEGFLAAEVLVDLQSDSPDLPDWWQLTNPGGCRQGALSAVADFASTPGSCPDPWPGQTATVVSSWITADFPDVSWPEVSASNRALLAFGGWVGAPVSLSAGTEYYGFTVHISHLGTTGTGACTGCHTPVTLVLNQVKLIATLHNVLNTPIDNMCLRWQAGGVTPCDATPAQNRTWGQVKSLYR